MDAVVEVDARMQTPAVGPMSAGREWPGRAIAGRIALLDG